MQTVIINTPLTIKTRFAALSDLHNNSRSLIKTFEILDKDNLLPSFLLCAGDIETYDIDILAQLTDTYDFKIYTVLGNHETMNDVCRIRECKNIEFIKNEIKEIQDIRVLGISMYLEDLLKINTKETRKYNRKLWSFIMQGFDVLLTHYPPFEILDYVLTSCKDGYHLGSRVIRNFLRLASPKLHIFGHVHEEQSMAYEVFGDIMCVNCAGKFFIFH